MLKLVSIVGARPQFIKAAAVSRELARCEDVSEVMVHTGQHYDDNMSAVFFRELEIPPPAFDLRIGSGTHGAQTGRMLEVVEEVLVKEMPDWVVVYGDANSTLAGALAAAKLRIPVAHVEAGLRSFNRRMPEEINRVLTDHASELLLAPTEAAMENLRREGIATEKAHLVGDVMYDAALYYGQRVGDGTAVLAREGLEAKNYILATVHRAENTEDPRRLGALLEGLGRVASEIPVICPLHPRTRAAARANGQLDSSTDRMRIIEPVTYLEMVALEKNASLIATDSGGVQKEAFFYQVPCITLRQETEWVELVDLGWNRLLAPVDAPTIEAGIRAALRADSPPPSDRHPYGDGRAAERIVAYLCSSIREA